jgi:hypothetical protein
MRGTPIDATNGTISDAHSRDITTVAVTVRLANRILIPYRISLHLPNDRRVPGWTSESLEKPYESDPSI